MFHGHLPSNFFKYLSAMMNGNMDNDGLQYMGDDYYFVWRRYISNYQYYYDDFVTIDIKGNYIDVVKIQTLLTTIEFSNNSFKQEIPKVIGKLGSLKGLNVSHNNLMGHTPILFGNLTNLEWLDPPQTSSQATLLYN